jgi:hypothetical protein
MGSDVGATRDQVGAEHRRLRRHMQLVQRRCQRGERLHRLHGECGQLVTHQVDLLVERFDLRQGIGQRAFALLLFHDRVQTRADALVDQRQHLLALLIRALHDDALALQAREREIGAHDLRGDLLCGDGGVGLGRACGAQRGLEVGLLAAEEIGVPGHAEGGIGLVVYAAGIRRRKDAVLRQQFALDGRVETHLRQLRSARGLDDGLRPRQARGRGAEAGRAVERLGHERVELGVAELVPPLRIDGRGLLIGRQAQRIGGAGGDRRRLVAERGTAGQHQHGGRRDGERERARRQHARHVEFEPQVLALARCARRGPRLTGLRNRAGAARAFLLLIGAGHGESFSLGSLNCWQWRRAWRRHWRACA